MTDFAQELTGPDQQGHDNLALSLRNVSKRFGGVQALDRVSFEVGLGEVHCLAGENGCGKSTLIKIVTGVYEPDDGSELTYFGERIDNISPSLARHHGIAVIWQDLALFPHMTVAENIVFETMVGRRRIGIVSQAALYEKASAALQKLNVEIDLNAKLGQLPIAQRQVVAIARALVSDTKLIFMDEPTASLTQSETDSLLEIVRTLAAQKVAIVFVSHRLAEVLEIASRVTVVRDGKLVGVFPTEGMSQSRLGELMTGKLLESEPHARQMSQASVRLEVNDLGRQGEYAGVNIKLREGEILGITGLIGAGRTEVAHTIFGMNKAHTGQFLIDGVECEFRSNRDAIDAGIAYVSEDRLTLGLIQPQSIGENTVSSVLGDVASKLGLIIPKRRGALVDHWVDALGIKIGLSTDAVATLSGGNQQKVVLSKWLATKPKVLILDSPTVGVDVGARAGIFEIVRNLAQSGLSILLISDEISEVHANADRIVHMAGGRLMGEYDPAATSIEELENIVYA